MRAVALVLAAAPLSGCAGKGSYHRQASNPEADVPAAAADVATVSPLPGTVDASPRTQISFLGRRGMRIFDVHVVGSLSGMHPGVLRAYSTGTGASFLPAQPFRAGERVSVTARIDRGIGRPAATTFEVATAAAVSEAEFPHEAGDPQAVQRYLSAPGLNPSRLTVRTPARRDATPGDFFLAPYQGEGSPGPMIVDQAGQLVWFHPLASEQQATNFGVQRYRGRPALVWWQGRIVEAGFGRGEDVIYDGSYRHVASVRAGNGYAADLHVVQLTPQGTAWIDAFAPVEEDLTAVGGASRAILTDSVVQEVDIATGLVMWEWHALGHLPLAESQSALATGGYPWDYAHVNSVDPGADGDVLVSARGTWAVYDVDIHSGGVRWRLGGKSSSFRLGTGAVFYWQHDARFQGAGRISLFDNGSEPPEEKQSRGIVLSLSPKTHSVSLVSQLVNPSRTLLSNSQGSMSELEGGNWLVGYGRLPDLTEFGPDGSVLFDATLGRGVQDFSVSLSRWEGRPRTQPSLIARRLGPGRVEAHVSWNGATEVRSWRVLAGRAPRELTSVATVPRSGFETAIVTRAGASYLAVQALDRSARSSAPLRSFAPERPSGRRTHAGLRPVEMSLRAFCSAPARRGGTPGRAGVGRVVVGDPPLLRAAEVLGERRPQLFGDGTLELSPQRVLQRAATGYVGELEAAALRAVVVELGFGSLVQRVDDPVRPARVGRVLGRMRAQADDVQRRGGVVGFDRELGDDLICGVEHVWPTRR
jgi:hypothetical protein